MICPKCHTPNPDDGKFCKKCGTSLAVVVCPSCKKENDSDSEFCTYCGAPLSAAENKQSKSAPQKHTQSEVAEEKEKSKESKGKSLLLASKILLGVAVAALVFTFICRFSYQTIIEEEPSRYNENEFVVSVNVYSFAGKVYEYYFHGNAVNYLKYDEYPPSSILIENMTDDAVESYQRHNTEALLWCAIHLAWTLIVYLIVKKLIIPKMRKK